MARASDVSLNHYRLLEAGYRPANSPALDRILRVLDGLLGDQEAAK